MRLRGYIGKIPVLEEYETIKFESSA